MARRRKAFEDLDVMSMLLDPIFGFVGALMALFLIQLILSMNSIDRDLVLKLDYATEQVERLSEQAQKAEASEALGRALDAEAKESRRQVTVCQTSLSETQQASAICEVAKSECERKLDSSGDTTELEARIASLKEQCRTAIAGGVVITTSQLPSAIKDGAYAVTLAAEGGVAPLHWSVNGALPEGMKLDADRGVISGIARAAGKTNFSVTVRDSSKEVSSNSRNLTLEVVQAGRPLQKSETAGLPWWVWFLMLGPTIAWIVGRIRYWFWLREMIRKHGGTQINIPFQVPRRR